MLTSKYCTVLLCALWMTCSTVWGATTTAPATKPRVAAFAIGDAVEVKWGGLWEKAAVKNKSPRGWILIAYDKGRTFEWVEPWRVRKPGSTTDVPYASPNQRLIKPEAPPTEAPTLEPPPEKSSAEKSSAPKSSAERAAERAREMASSANPSTRAATSKPAIGAPEAPAAALPVTPADESKVKELSLAAIGPAWTISPDPITPMPKTVTAPIALKGGSRDFYEKIEIVPPRGASGSALINYVDAAPGKPEVVRSERVNLTTGASSGAIVMPTPSLPLDVSPNGQRLLSRVAGGQVGERDRIDLWAVQGAQPPKHQLSFEPYDKDDWTRRDAEWAAFADDTHVLTLSRGGQLVSWDVSAAPKAIWRVKLSGYDASLVFSPSRKYLAAVDEKGVALIDPIQGTLLARLPDGEHRFQSLAFRADGKQLAGLAAEIVYIWDLATGKLVDQVLVPGNVGGDSVAFAGEGYILIGGRHLLDLERRIILWEYDARAMRRNTVSEWASRFWYVTPGGKQAAPMLVSVALPHDAAKQLAGTLKSDDLLLIKPGISVSLDVNIEASAEERQKVTDALTARLKQNNITVAEGQPIKLEASTKLGETREQEYRQFRTGETSKVSITPKITRLAFIAPDGKTAWDLVSSSGASGILTLKEGQTAQAAADASARYDLSFFKRAWIPKYVTKPRESAAIGKSALTARGVDAARGRPVKP